MAPDWAGVDCVGAVWFAASFAHLQMQGWVSWGWFETQPHKSIRPKSASTGRIFMVEHRVHAI
jgi:hypothetical protein